MREDDSTCFLRVIVYWDESDLTANKCLKKEEHLTWRRHSSWTAVQLLIFKNFNFKVAFKELFGFTVTFFNPEEHEARGTVWKTSDTLIILNCY